VIASRFTPLRITANAALLVPLAFGLYVGFLALWRLQSPSIIYGLQFATPLPVHPGQVITVNFKVLRRRTCSLEISRVMERKEDRKEFQVSFSNQLIEANPNEISTSYRMTIPVELASGTYWLYTRYRYYCNGLDNWIPFVRRSNALKVEVTAP